MNIYTIHNITYIYYTVYHIHYILHFIQYIRIDIHILYCILYCLIISYHILILYTGKHVLNLGHGVEKDTSEEAVAVFVDAAKNVKIKQDLIKV